MQFDNERSVVPTTRMHKRLFNGLRNTYISILLIDIKNEVGN